MYGKTKRWYINQQVAYAITCPMLVEDERCKRRAFEAMIKSDSFFRFLRNFWNEVSKLKDIIVSFEYLKSKNSHLERIDSPPYFYLKAKEFTRKKIQWVEFDFKSNETNILMEFVLPNPYLAYNNNNAFIEYFKDRIEEENWINIDEQYYKKGDTADFYLTLDGFAGASGYPNFFLLPFIKIRWYNEPCRNRP